MPKAAEGTIILIDTDFLKQNVKLSSGQSDAIKHYNGAKDKYEGYSPEQSEAGAEQLKILTAELSTAQKSLLKAFPELKIVYE